MGACSANSTPAACPAVQNSMESRMVDTAGTERSWSTCDSNGPRGSAQTLLCISGGRHRHTQERLATDELICTASRRQAPRLAVSSRRRVEFASSSSSHQTEARTGMSSCLGERCTGKQGRFTRLQAEIGQQRAYQAAALEEDEAQDQGRRRGKRRLQERQRRRRHRRLRRRHVPQALRRHDACDGPVPSTAARRLCSKTRSQVSLVSELG